MKSIIKSDNPFFVSLRNFIWYSPDNDRCGMDYSTSNPFTFTPNLHIGVNVAKLPCVNNVWDLNYNNWKFWMNNYFNKSNE